MTEHEPPPRDPRRPLPKCQSCGTELSMAVVYQIESEHRISWVIHPKAPGQMLSAGTLGGTIVQFEKMMKAFAREVGSKEAVLVERLSTGDDGSLRVDFLVCATPQKSRLAETSANSGERQ